MVLLESIVEVGVTTVGDLTAKRLANRTGVGIMSIGRHSLWPVAYNIDGVRR